jgi:hypothetical protein
MTLETVKMSNMETSQPTKKYEFHTTNVSLMFAMMYLKEDKISVM